MRIETRTERHVLKPSDPYYSLIRGFCKVSKDLYNHGNYLVRQKFIKEGLWLRYGSLDKTLRADTEYPDYKAMPTAQSAQQTLRMLDAVWKSFFVAIKDWKKNKKKYLGRPKPPKYLKKDGCYCLVLTSQECKVKDGMLKFPKVFEGFSIKPRFLSDSRFASFQQVRFVPHKESVAVELVYKISVPEEKPDNGHYIGIDIGVNNLAAVVNSWNGQPFIINGRPLKSMNQFANKEKARIQLELELANGRKISKRLYRLLEKRGRKLDNYMHQASRHIINYCLENDVSKVIIGKNDLWKQKAKVKKKNDPNRKCSMKMVRVNNQNFVQIPLERFIRMLEYKAKEHGIAVTLTEEGYTSGTSFIDGEAPDIRNYDKGRRKFRGLFISNKASL